MNSFTFVTYNIDSSDYNFEERLDAFIDLVSPYDIVVIQEGRQYTYEKLGREMSKRGLKYSFLDILKEKKTGEVIYSKFPIESYKFYPFLENGKYEQRGITVAQLNVYGEKITVVTTQLYNTTPIQSSQLYSIPRILKKNKYDGNIILGGDFSLSSFQEIEVPEGWEDLWYDYGDGSSEYTVDYKKNILVKSPIQDRSDRIWIHSKGNLICEDFSLIGEESDVVISSHFGIIATFSITFESNLLE